MTHALTIHRHQDLRDKDAHPLTRWSSGLMSEFVGNRQEMIVLESESVSSAPPFHAVVRTHELLHTHTAFAEDVGCNYLTEYQMADNEQERVFRS